MKQIRQTLHIKWGHSARVARLFVAMLCIFSSLAVVGFGSVASAACPVKPVDLKLPYQVDISCLPTTTTNGKVKVILGIVFTILGAISLLMVTIGGFRYVLSEGDPQGVSKAKNTIVFALIGLLVSISAVAVVDFVVGKV